MFNVNGFSIRIYKCCFQEVMRTKPYLSDYVTKWLEQKEPGARSIAHELEYKNTSMIFKTFPITLLHSFFLRHIQSKYKVVIDGGYGAALYLHRVKKLTWRPGDIDIRVPNHKHFQQIISDYTTMLQAVDVDIDFQFDIGNCSGLQEPAIHQDVESSSRTSSTHAVTLAKLRSNTASWLHDGYTNSIFFCTKTKTEKQFLYTKSKTKKQRVFFKHEHNLTPHMDTIVHHLEHCAQQRDFIIKNIIKLKQSHWHEQIGFWMRSLNIIELHFQSTPKRTWSPESVCNIFDLYFVVVLLY